MKSFWYSFVLAFFLVSCAKTVADKEASLRDTVVAPKGASSGESSAMGSIDTSSGPSEKMPTAAEVPIGKLPILHSSVLAQFQPNPTGFYRYRSAANDTSIKAESVAFFRATGDTTRILRSVIVDQNEQTASTLVKELLEIKARGYKDFTREGKQIRAYYTEINGMPAIKQFNPDWHSATVNILCGDHRLVLLREDKVSSEDHLIEVAKTMDLKRLSEIVP